MTKRRGGRTWTDEQRRAASERMRLHNPQRERARTETATETVASTAEPEDEVSGIAVASPVRDRAPEVQAVVDEMTPERRAKLEAVQARRWAQDAASDSATRDALARHAALKEQGQPGVAESLTGARAVTAVLGNEAVRVEVRGQELTSGILTHRASDEVPPPVVMTKVKPTHPFRFTSGQNGLMISELGNCLCGQPKLRWHEICLARETTA